MMSVSAKRNSGSVCYGRRESDLDQRADVMQLALYAASTARLALILPFLSVFFRNHRAHSLGHQRADRAVCLHHPRRPANIQIQQTNRKPKWLSSMQRGVGHR